MFERRQVSRTLDHYLALRRRYEPRDPALVIVAESPPVSGLYFYDPDSAVTEPLFAALTRQAGISADTKESGLEALKRRGWVLLDATYEPVNAFKGAERDRIILRDYPILLRHLASLITKQSTPIILLKVNVCRLLEPKLISDGFAVLNGGRRVPFPSTGQQTKFHSQFGAILSRADV